MGKARLSAAVLNRKRQPGKVTDGGALTFTRNQDGSLAGFQRIKTPEGRDREVAVAKLRPGEEMTELMLNRSLTSPKKTLIQINDLA